MRCGILLTCSLICAVVSCREEPTANLHLILAKPDAHLFNPVPSPDGQVIYFLEHSSPDSSLYDVFRTFGDIRGVSTYSGTDWPILEGRFELLSLSPDGARLVAAAWYESDTMFHSYLLIAADTMGNVLDSFVVRAGGIYDDADLSDLHFSLTGDAVFYMVYHRADSGEIQSRVYRKGLSGDTATTVAAEYSVMVQRFALLPGDTILVDTARGSGDLAVCPTGTRWMIRAVSAQSIFVPWEWRLTDRLTGKVSYLSNATLPEGMEYLDWPAWMPNGKDLLFGTGSTSGPEGMHPDPAQLWRLDNALEFRQ